MVHFQRASIISTFKNILPCAFPMRVTFEPFFQYVAWFDLVEKISSSSQMHAALQIFDYFLQDPSVYGNLACSRCDMLFSQSETPKIAACASCFSTVHHQCVDNNMEEDPNVPFWKCSKCYRKKGLAIGYAVVEEVEKEIPVEDQYIINSGRSLRVCPFSYFL